MNNSQQILETLQIKFKYDNTISSHSSKDEKFYYQKTNQKLKFLKMQIYGNIN